MSRSRHSRTSTFLAAAFFGTRPWASRPSQNSLQPFVLRASEFWRFDPFATGSRTAAMCASLLLHRDGRRARIRPTATCAGRAPSRQARVVFVRTAARKFTTLSRGGGDEVAIWSEAGRPFCNRALLTYCNHWYRHPGSNGGPLDPQSCGRPYLRYSHIRYNLL